MATLHMPVMSDKNKCIKSVNAPYKHGENFRVDSCTVFARPMASSTPASSSQEDTLQLLFNLGRLNSY